MTPPPVRFAFGLHIHQPVGNFDHVFQDHVDGVYLPFLERMEARGLFPCTLHVSGPLLEWMEAHDRRVLDRIGRWAADGRVELLASGLYEPVLAALPSADRVEQVEWMRSELMRLFGVDATGLWLTERVWEPDLASDLARAGIRFALVDDHHFLVTGFERDALHVPYTAEHDGRRVALFPIDERLRYLVPFRPPGELAHYLRSLREQGHGLAVLADDGEKFGGWPGTADWLYQQGWLDAFFDTMDALREGGEVEMTTLAAALDAVPPAGPAYLHTASYREMETWALPTPAGRRLRDLAHALGSGMDGPEGAAVRGSHWKNFLVKYREAGRMHQKALHLSRLCREAGDPPEARRAVARAQCNDAYWHGVFGGLYLKHLRDAVWRQLALAEGVLRAGQRLAVEPVDLDADGRPELWVHAAAFSALVTPALGGALEEYTSFEAGINFANGLTRRREVYHHPELGGSGENALDGERAGPGEGHGPDGDSGDGGAGPDPDGGMPSIHHLEAGFAASGLPPVDPHDRALFVDRLLEGSPDAPEEARTVRTWARTPLRAHRIRTADGTAWISLTADDGSLEKTFRFLEDGTLDVSYRWEPDHALHRWFAVELSFGDVAVHHPEPEPARTVVQDVRTVSRTEEGLAESVQGRAVTFLWPATLGGARIRLEPRPAPPDLPR